MNGTFFLKPKPTPNFNKNKELTRLASHISDKLKTIALFLKLVALI